MTRWDRKADSAFQIAPYFAKVECFCFEEQKIRAGEEVDLPVFFFIDRDILDDPQLSGIDDVILSYTFFKSVQSHILLHRVRADDGVCRARRNDKGHAIPDAPEDVIQKSQGFDKYEHAKPIVATA
jgi:cytochrome c oxidase assembly protein subunit 11